MITAIDCIRECPRRSMHDATEKRLREVESNNAMLLDALNGLLDVVGQTNGLSQAVAKGKNAVSMMNCINPVFSAMGLEEVKPTMSLSRYTKDNDL